MVARHHFNPSHAEVAATVGGHRRIALVCPTCAAKFALNPSDFAQRKRENKDRLICCSKPCSAIEQALRHHLKGQG